MNASSHRESDGRKQRERKHPRLSQYDYSKSGAYFITICTEHWRRCLSSVIYESNGISSQRDEKTDDTNCGTVGRGLAPAGIQLTLLGKLAEEQLLSLESRYPFLSVDRYVIMPNHIHVIFVLKPETAGASPRPTVTDIVCAYKSLITRKWNENKQGGKVFQTSFYEHIIRNLQDYQETVKYIFDNPMKWHFDELFSEE